MFQVGDVVERYTILAHLRSGGMADLFLARRNGAMGFRRLVAIKVVHSRHAEDEHVVRMFLDEALISARIDHPNVVHVEDLGEIDETYYLVMEYVHGCSLAQLMRVLGKMHRRLSPLVAVAIAARVAEGLHAAHETTDDAGKLVNLVHRDVSPQNILLSHKGHVKLIDFGVAKAELRSEKTNVAMLKGKVRYMPPEQATTGIVDRRSDVYSLGIVLWEMLTMRRLFAGKTEFEVLLKVRSPKIDAPSRYVGDIPKALDDVVLSALAVDPDRRPSTAKSFRRMLARALPKAMSFDSAHLAELMLSIVGEQLEAVLHELPQDVSRLLEAEQLRVALQDKERGGDEDTTESAVEVMTVHSRAALFQEDALDDTPEVSAPIPYQRPASGESKVGGEEYDTDADSDEFGSVRQSFERASFEREARQESLSTTTPGGPIAKRLSKSATSSELGVMSSQDAEAKNAETEDDADPTVVGSVPAHLLGKVGERAAPIDAGSAPPTVRDAAFVPMSQSSLPPPPELPSKVTGPRPLAIWGWVAAVVLSVGLGIALVFALS